MVPQDTVLFNENIGYNIRYGNTEASDNEVYVAAQSADIEKFILSLSEGRIILCSVAEMLTMLLILRSIEKC